MVKLPTNGGRANLGIKTLSSSANWYTINFLRNLHEENWTTGGLKASLLVTSGAQVRL